MRLAQSPRELSSPVPRVRCAELAQLWLNPIMSSNYFYFLGHDADFEKLRQTGIKSTEIQDTLKSL